MSALGGVWSREGCVWSRECLVMEGCLLSGGVCSGGSAHGVSALGMSGLEVVWSGWECLVWGVSGVWSRGCLV